MGWPRTAPLTLAPRRVRAARQRPVSVVEAVFADFLAAVEGGDRHDRNGRLVDEVATPKTPRRPESDPRLTTGGAD